jgi:hypothetical protein
MAVGRGVTVAVFAAVAVMPPGRLVGGGRRESPHPADIGQLIVLELAMRNGNPTARRPVTHADPA